VEKKHAANPARIALDKRFDAAMKGLVSDFINILSLCQLVPPG
jgi:hypothetical protein